LFHTEIIAINSTFPWSLCHTV